MRGFTLVEMLVALAALALLAAAGLTVTQFAVGARETLGARQQESRELLRLSSLLRSDLTQAAPRRAREASGRKPQAALAGSNVYGDGVFLSFVRRGRDNTGGAPRSSLQYVEYRIREGRVERLSRIHVDGAPTGDPVVLAEGVRGVDVAFFQFNQWASAYAGSPDRPLPRAVRVELDFADRGRLSQSFLLPETDR